jgi:peptidoglycan/xylan/chitin deacetylase (PgdA/CDA1 family)
MTDAPTVCLTFDCDSMSNWIGSLGASDPGTVTRGEFDIIGTQRILRLLAKYGIEATFCVPGFTVCAYPDLIREIDAAGHELAHHGWIHESPRQFDRAGERDILLKGIEVLERVIGKRPVGYRSPGWEFSASTVGLLLEEGFRYDSGLMADDFYPYYVRDGDVVSTTEPYVFGETTDLVEMPVSYTLNDWTLFEFADGVNAGLASPAHVLEIWQGDFDYMTAECADGVYVLTMHPQVIGRGHRMTMLERLITHMADRARFSCMTTFAEHWRAENPLEAWKHANPMRTGAAALANSVGVVRSFRGAAGVMTTDT